LNTNKQLLSNIKQSSRKPGAKLKNVLYVSVHGQVDPKDMSQKYYAKLYKHDIYDLKTYDEVVEMFGESIVSTVSILMDEQIKKLSTDSSYRSKYTKWFEQHNLADKKQPGKITPGAKGAPGAPSSYNTPLSMFFISPARKVQFQQGNNFTCAFSSLCSAIHAFANGNKEIEEIAASIHKKRKPHLDSDLFTNLKIAVDKAAKGKFILRKIKKFHVNNQLEPGPVLGVLMDNGGGVEHAVSFWGNEIFDSNLSHTLARGNTLYETRKVLDHCCFPRKFTCLKLAYRFEKIERKEICYIPHKRKRET